MTFQSNLRKKSSIRFTQPSLAVQSEKDSCCINRIMKRYEKTGVISHLNTRTPLYGDFSELNDYRSVVERIQAVQEHFLTLPAEVRLKFNNDPASYLDALDDPSRKAELIALGVLQGADTPSQSVSAPEQQTPPADAVGANGGQA